MWYFVFRIRSPGVNLNHSGTNSDLGADVTERVRPCGCIVCIRA